jgi:hypothetical protein
MTISAIADTADDIVGAVTVSRRLPGPRDAPDRSKPDGRHRLEAAKDVLHGG